MKIILHFIAMFFTFGVCSVLYADDTVEFSNFLEKLDKSKKESILTAMDEFQKKFSIAGKQKADEAFRLYINFYIDVVRECDHIFYDRRDCQDLLWKISEIADCPLDNPLPAFEKVDYEFSKEIKTKYENTLNELYEYRNCGMDFTQGEGDWYLEEDYAFLVGVLSDIGSKDLKEYLVFRANEDKERLGYDAGLLISWEDLRKRIMRWEQFARYHPTLLETKEEIKPDLKILLEIYLNGASNTPGYDLWKSGKIEDSLRKSYEIFLKENTTSSYHGLIKSVYGILKKHKFKISKELVIFVKKQGYTDAGVERQVEMFLNRKKK